MAFQRSEAQLQTAGHGHSAKAVLGVRNSPTHQQTQLRRDKSNLHIVDQLIEERGGKLANSFFWPLLRPFLYRFLHYKEAVAMADEVAPMSGVDAMNFVSKRLSLDVQVEGFENVPHEGGFVLVCNHPTGIADGVAIWDVFNRVRGDMSVFANRDATRVNRNLPEVIIPVEWREGHKTRDKSRETLKLTNQAISDGRPIVIFPSGRIAYWANGGLNEREWQSSALALAKKYNLPVLPANMKSRNSGLFYWFAKWSTELRDMTVFHELLNKQNSQFEITFGEMIQADQIQGDVSELTQQMQEFCTNTLAEDPAAKFTSEKFAGK